MNKSLPSALDWFHLTIYWKIKSCNFIDRNFSMQSIPSNINYYATLLLRIPLILISSDCKVIAIIYQFNTFIACIKHIYYFWIWGITFSTHNTRQKQCTHERCLQWKLQHQTYSLNKQTKLTADVIFFTPKMICFAKYAHVLYHINHF